MSRKYNIEEIASFAINKEGKLLSTEYIGAHSKLLWQCSCNYTWLATWDSIKNASSWCPSCGNQKKYTIDELQLFAKEKDGILLSAVYKKAIDKLLWQCKEKHIWSSSWNSIKNQDSWCPVCSVKKQKPDICELQAYALNHQGILISTDYINSYIKLIWQCKEGHQWSAFWGDIKKGSWCPQCSKFKSEDMCIKVAESVFGCPFIKKRIKYIIDSNSHVFLEFDGYNEEHKLAIEYNGIQHYIYPNYWHKTKCDFNYQQERDKRKREYCSKNNITLIEVPYTEIKTLNSFIISFKKENELNIVAI